MGRIFGLDGRPLTTADEDLRLRTIAMNAWAAREASRMFGECALRACLSPEAPGFVLYQMSSHGVPAADLALVQLREFLEKLHARYWPGTLAACEPPPNFPLLPEPRAYVRFEPRATASPAGKTENPG